MATKKEEIIDVSKKETSVAIGNDYITGISALLQEKQEYGLSFPADYNPTNELMGAYMILKQTTDRSGKPLLATCTKESVVNTLMDMVVSGVSMQKKQCYPVAYQGKLQCQMSVYGNTCIARRYGLKSITATCIYKDDNFDYHIEDGEIVIDRHTQDFMSIDFDKMIGAYAVAVMNDGTKHIELMNMAMIKKAWSQGFGYKEGAGVHEKFKDQMAEKTVKNRCLKYIIRTYGEPTVYDMVENSEELESKDLLADSVEQEIINNANTVEFVAEEVEDVEIVYDDVPPFMKEEE